MPETPAIVRSWITVGSDVANPMMLYAQDWVGGYCDNRGGLMQATETELREERAAVEELL